MTANTRTGPYTYGLIGNPNSRELERMLASLDGAAGAVVVESGLAAVSVALLLGCDPVAIQLRVLEVIAARGGPERLEHWRRELPQLVASIGAKERERREQELVQARPHPGCEVPTVPLAEAEAQLREAVEGWSLKARGYAPSELGNTPPRQLLAVDVGLG